MHIKTAIILAAGKGTRLKNVTGDDYPKPLTPVDDRPIIEYSIQALLNAGVERILIGCGHLLESFEYLEEKYEEVEIIENPKYDVYASIYTLLMFEPLVNSPFYLLEADILYDPQVLKELAREQKDQNKIITSAPLDLDDNVYFWSENGRLMELSKRIDKEEPEGVMTGIWVLSAGFLTRFAAYCNEAGVDYSEDYEVLLGSYSAGKEPINIAHFRKLSWCEIDNEDHLEHAIEQVLPKIKKDYSQ